MCASAATPQLQVRVRRKLVGAIGFEPMTPCAQGRCATRLRYAPTRLDSTVNFDAGHFHPRRRLGL